MKLPGVWQQKLGAELEQPYFTELEAFLVEERATQTIFPPEEEVFAAFELTPFEEVKVFLLGQDPYPSPGHAHGLCFSVKPGVKPPQSLKNIYKELNADLGCPIPEHGNLTAWASQGMLMLNAVLTVRAGKANSHKNKGWEKFTDAVIRVVNDKSERVVFLLWGAFAQKKRRLIDEDRHAVITGTHPSPLSAHNGFYGSKPFSAINRLLEQGGREPIDWTIPPL
jgi:uracil-DNA glycosylase